MMWRRNHDYILQISISGGKMITSSGLRHRISFRTIGGGNPDEKSLYRKAIYEQHTEK